MAAGDWCISMPAVVDKDWRISIPTVPTRSCSLAHPLLRVWKGFCVIRDSAEIELVIREYRENPAVIREFCIGCDAGFSFSVVRDS